MRCVCDLKCVCDMTYGVALASRIDKIIGLFCKRALKKRRYSAKETYDCIDPTDCSHPIGVWYEMCVWYDMRNKSWVRRVVTYVWCDTQLFCRYTGLFCRHTGLFCGYTGLFCGVCDTRYVCDVRNVWHRSPVDRMTRRVCVNEWHDSQKKDQEEYDRHDSQQYKRHDPQDYEWHDSHEIQGGEDS